MFYNYFDESVKTRLECNLGCFVLEELYSACEYDLLDAYSVVSQFVPAGYIPCRDSYFYSCF